VTVHNHKWRWCLRAALLPLLLLASGCLFLTPVEVQDIRVDINQTKLDLGRLRDSQNSSFRKLQFSIEQIEKSIDAQQEQQRALREDIELQLVAIRDELARLSTPAPVQVVATSPAQPAPAQPTPAQPVAAASPSTDDQMAAEREEVFRKGEEATSVSNYDQAIEIYSDFLLKHPDSADAPKASYFLARCYYSMEDYERAHRAFNHLIGTYPASDIVPQTLHSRALCEYNLKRFEEARVTLGSIKTQYPDYEPERIQTILDQLP
jgi:TolA-binding protein